VQGFVGAKHALKRSFGSGNHGADGNQSRTRSRDIEQVYAHDENNPTRRIMGTTKASTHEQLAIDSLLVTDELFLNTQVKTRKKYVQLVEFVRRMEERSIFVVPCT
jgi:protein pelota